MILPLIIGIVLVLLLIFGEQGSHRLNHWWHQRHTSRTPYTWGCPECQWGNETVRRWQRWQYKRAQK